MQRITVLCLAVALVAALACDSGADDEQEPAGESGGPPDVIAFGAAGPDGDALYMVKPDGTQLRSLAPEEDTVAYPVWSPDGSRVAYAVGEPEGPDPVDIEVYDFADGSVTPVTALALTSDAGPPMSWSPDGDRLVVADLTAGSGVLRVYDLSAAEFVEFPEVAAAGASWSPDGDQIAFTAEDGVYLIDADGEGEPELLVEAESLAAPVWSPSGEQILVTAGTGQERTLSVVDVASGTARDIGPGFLGAWSRDGAQIAFSAFSESGETDYDLFVSLPAAGSRQTLSDAVTRDISATWAPGGRRVAYVSLADPQTGFICVVQLDPPQRDCLDLPDLTPASPAWSPLPGEEAEGTPATGAPSGA